MIATHHVTDLSAERNADAFRRHLGPKIMGVEQEPSGSYAGFPQELSDSDLHEHFSGQRTFGFRCVVSGKCRFGGFDIDDRFPQRLRLLRAAIERRNLGAATLLTSGSDANRGKLIVFFARPRSPQGVRRLLESMKKEVALQGSDWGIERPGSVSIFPYKKTGGLLRIGSRNLDPSRAAKANDRFFSLDGALASLDEIAPALRVRLRVDPQPVRPAPIGTWVSKTIAKGVSYNNARGSKGVIAKLSRFAFEAIRFYGPRQGHVVYETWMDDLWKASPDQQGPSPSGDTRIARSWQRRVDNAWEYATKRTLSSPGPPSPKETRQCSHCHAVREVLITYAVAKGMTPCAFAISYREIAVYGGFGSLSSVFRHMKHLEAKGGVVVHDRGTRGEKGLPTLLGVVLDGEQTEDVRKRGSARWNVRERKRIIEAYQARREERLQRPVQVAA